MSNSILSTGADLGILKGGGTWCAGPALAKAVYSAEKFFHLHFSVVWIGSRSTFVLCTHC